MTRRRLIKTLPLLACLPGIGAADNLPPPARLKSGYAQRLKKILATRRLPYIDIESSCNSTRVDADAVAHAMDRLDIGLMALSADIGRNQFGNGVRFNDLSERLLAAWPDRFVPVGNGGQPPALTEDPEAFLYAQEAAARERKVMLLGEHEFRHYPSPRQVKRGETDRDVDVPIDGPVGRRLFRLSETLGVPFQIHYEIEDGLLARLERMLELHPQAALIWCHLAQVRYSERAPRYTASYVESLIKRFPNLYFDTAFGDAASVYPVSGQRHARVWDASGGSRRIGATSSSPIRNGSCQPSTSARIGSSASSNTI